jgi:hypothetical protein
LISAPQVGIQLWASAINAVQIVIDAQLLINAQDAKSFQFFREVSAELTFVRMENS